MRLGVHNDTIAVPQRGLVTQPKVATLRGFASLPWVRIPKYVHNPETGCTPATLLVHLHDASRDEPLRFPLELTRLRAKSLPALSYSFSHSGKNPPSN